MDAAIGMIPLLGDVTAVRDLLAVIIGLSMDPRKREDRSQWLLLVVLAFALIPVIGGVIKGVGRMLVKTMGEVAQLASGAERAAKLADAAKDITGVLNRLGVGNAERWLADLRIFEHQQALLKNIDALAKALHDAAGAALARAGNWLPEPLVAGTRALSRGLEDFRKAAPEYIPDALKELDEHLREIQAYIRSGGEATSQTVAHSAQSGATKVHRVDEVVLLEGKGATRSVRGGWAANSAEGKSVAQYYQPRGGSRISCRGRRTWMTASACIPMWQPIPGESSTGGFSPASESFAFSDRGGTRTACPSGARMSREASSGGLRSGG